MLERAQVKALPLLNRSVEIVPAVQACCGVCRSCMTSNVFALAGAGLATLGLYAKKVIRKA
jgi:hypothetical protein